MFYVKVKNLEERSKLLQYLKEKDILGIFHYIPLHSSMAGRIYGRFHGEDRWTTKESERIIRLPLYCKIPKDSLTYVIETIYKFFGF
jgi:dTDP-4-amino-4,6-dideoxygalactose transaminase